MTAMPHTRVVLITGVSRGLGAAMAEGLIEQGCTVVGCARSPERIDRLRDRHAAPHAWHVVDVANDQQVASWAAAILASHGPPDLLLNNAAIINHNAELWNVSAEQFSAVVDVNIKGTFHIIRHFLPAMIERGSGVVVNFSSGWGRATSPQVAPYCATKWAIEGLTRALAEELPAGMAAIALNPGIIHTDMLDSCFGTSAASFPSPRQWAKKTVPFLLKLNPSHNGTPLTAP